LHPRNHPTDHFPLIYCLSIKGDLERDYNAFKIESTFFSQGPGNFRDIAQNRRNDVTFSPRMGSFDIQMFLSYIQADGYEPLTVEAVVYRYEDSDLAIEVAKNVTNDAKSAETLGNVLNGGAFRPGQLFTLVEQLKINLSVTNEVFINAVLAGAQDRASAVYGQGYWADHWDYYIDMIEAYLDIYPDIEEELMYDKELRYFFSTATVRPRSEKYVLELTFDGKSHHVLQLDSTYFDSVKVKEQEAFRDQNTGCRNRGKLAAHKRWRSLYELSHCQAVPPWIPQVRHARSLGNGCGVRGWSPRMVG
jgi:hypothetical protein